jgi:hypothetical protein
VLIRYTGRLELFHHVRSKLGLYNCVGTTAQYLIRSCVLQELGGLEAVVIAVLKTLICLHPIMGVGLIDEEKGQDAKWKRLRTVDLREVLTFKCIHHDHEFILDEHQKPFDRPEELPLWRVVIAKHVKEELASPTGGEDHERDPDIIIDVGIYFNHAIADGTSGAAFHLDFLGSLNVLGARGIAVDEPPESIVNVPELPLLPPLDDAPWPITVMFLLKTAFKTFVWNGQDPKGQWLGPLLASILITLLKLACCPYSLIPSPLKGFHSSVIRKRRLSLRCLRFLLRASSHSHTLTTAISLP